MLRLLPSALFPHKRPQPSKPEGGGRAEPPQPQALLQTAHAPRDPQLPADCSGSSASQENCPIHKPADVVGKKPLKRTELGDADAHTVDALLLQDGAVEELIGQKETRPDLDSPATEPDAIASRARLSRGKHSPLGSATTPPIGQAHREAPGQSGDPGDGSERAALSCNSLRLGTGRSAHAAQSVRRLTKGARHEDARLSADSTLGLASPARIVWQAVAAACILLGLGMLVRSAFHAAGSAGGMVPPGASSLASAALPNGPDHTTFAPELDPDDDRGFAVDPITGAVVPVQAVPIEEVRLGQRVLAFNPERDPSERGRELEPDPLTWRTARLRMGKPDGSTAEIELLRPISWFEAQGVAVPKYTTRDRTVETEARVYLDLEELGLVGWAELYEIGPCPPIQSGPGAVVTGRFRHQVDELITLTVANEAGEAEELGVTPNHPIWSEDRQAFVPAGELRIGEQLRSLFDEQIRVVSIAPRAPPAYVCNLEVAGEHVYGVGEWGWLVHNAYHGSLPKPPAKHPTLRNIVKDMYKGADGPNPIGTGSTADAVRYERRTGFPVGGKWHTEKSEAVGETPEQVHKTRQKKPEGRSLRFVDRQELAL